jgi:hypothetical protein
MAERFNIYAGPPIVRALEQAGRDNKSGRMNDIAARYDAIIAHELAGLSFSFREWGAIVSANREMNGLTWRQAWANVSDRPEIAPRWKIDAQALATRMRALPVPAQAAIVEVIDRFWSLNADGDGAYDQLLAEAGVTFAQPEEASHVAP